MWATKSSTSAARAGAKASCASTPGGRRRDAADGRVAYAVLHVAAQLRLGLRYAAANGLGLARGLGIGCGGVGLGLCLCLGKLGVCLSVGSLLCLGDVLGGVACLILRVRRAAERVGNAVAALLKELADLLAREENQRQRQQQEVEDGADGSQKFHGVAAPFRFISFMVQPSCVGATHWRICAALRSAVSLPSRPPVSAVTSSGSFASTAAAAGGLFAAHTCTHVAHGLCGLLMRGLQRMGAFALGRALGLGQQRIRCGGLPALRIAARLCGRIELLLGGAPALIPS